ncbi:MAG: helix-turn-helix domain-containing protein [Candidatus Moraniibacteriota bacterium]
MPKGKELTFFERERIETYLRMKKKILWIAKKLGRDYSVIRKEVKRNTGEVLPYCAVDAQSYAERRKKNTNRDQKLLPLEKGLVTGKLTV